MPGRADIVDPGGVRTEVLAHWEWVIGDKAYRKGSSR